jgi:hypothetical protein
MEFSSPSSMQEAKGVLWSQRLSSAHLSSNLPPPPPLWESVDTFVPEDLESGALVQIALDANLATVFDSLLDDDGVEIELVDIATCSEVKETDIPQRVAFRDLVATQTKLNHVSIGIQRPKATGGFETLLCPSADLLCGACDKLIVLAFS